MRFIQKLVRNGNATAVSLPRPLLAHLGMLPGEMVLIELTEDDAIKIRGAKVTADGVSFVSGRLPDPAPTTGR